MNEFFLIAGMAIVTFIIRYPILAFLSKLNIPEKFTAGLNFVPPAVLTAIILPKLFLPEGQLDISFTNAQLLSGIIALLISWKSKNLLLTILFGMIIFLGMRWLLI